MIEDYNDFRYAARRFDAGYRADLLRYGKANSRTRACYLCPVSPPSRVSRRNVSTTSISMTFRRLTLLPVRTFQVGGLSFRAAYRTISLFVSTGAASVRVGHRYINVLAEEMP